MPQICLLWPCECVAWTRPSHGAVQYPEWAHIIGQSPPPVNCLLTTLSAQTRLACVLQPPDHKIRAEDGSLQRL